MSPQVISVSEFVAILNETLGFAYPEVVVEGEVSSFKVNQGKWIFFDLKDSESTLGCFMPLRTLKVPLEDGMKVRVTARPNLTKWGKFSLTVKSVELAGEGELRRAFVLLKAKLTAEGLFDDSRKRPLPRYPQRIGLITSGQSAAYSDFIKILGARWSGLTIFLADVQVQGAAAPDQIIEALTHFNHAPNPVDVVVLIRGGGSLEDLQAFSTEAVARAVAASRTPIVVGVGHEIDVSLADYAADLRAATPTDAARLVVPDRTEVTARINHLAGRLDQHLSRLRTSDATKIERAMNTLERFLRRPHDLVEILNARLEDAADRQFEHKKNRLDALTRVLAACDPTAVLQRGYAIVRQGSHILRDPAEVLPDQTLMIQLAKGTLEAQPKEQS